MKTKLVVETFDINNMDKMFFLHCFFFFFRFLVKNHESLLGLECITITEFSHVQCIWWWRRLDLWSNTAKTREGQVHCRRNSTPLPSIRPDDEWWKMRGRGRSKRRKSRGGEKKRHRIREQVWRRSVYLAKGDYDQTRWSKHFCQGCDSWRQENTERKKPREYVSGGIGRQGVWREQIQRECLL